MHTLGLEKAELTESECWELSSQCGGEVPRFPISSFRKRTELVIHPSSSINKSFSDRIRRSRTVKGEAFVQSFGHKLLGGRRPGRAHVEGAGGVAKRGSGADVAPGAEELELGPNGGGVGGGGHGTRVGARGVVGAVRGRGH